MLFANSNFKDLLVEGALIKSGIEIQCVSEHVWVGRGGLRGRAGELPAGNIRASQGTFSRFIYYGNKETFFSVHDTLRYKSFELWNQNQIRTTVNKTTDKMFAITFVFISLLDDMCWMIRIRQLRREAEEAVDRMKEVFETQNNE